LVARLTEMVITVALSAVTGLGNVLMAPAIRALKRQAAEKLLRTGSLRFCPSHIKINLQLIKVTLD